MGLKPRRERLYKDAEASGTDRPNKISSLCITLAKKTEARAWLSEVSSVVLQQSLRDLETAWKNYEEEQTRKEKRQVVRKTQMEKETIQTSY